MASLLTNCKTILSSLPVGLFDQRRNRLILQEAGTEIFKKAFRKEYRTLLTSCESVTVSHIYIASIRVSAVRKRPPGITHSANEQDADIDWNLGDGEGVSVSPVTPGVQTPCRTPSSLSSRIKARRPVYRTSPKCEDNPLGRQGLKGPTQSVQQRRPQRRRSRSVSAPQQGTRVRRRSNSVPRSLSCHVAEKKEQTSHRVQFAENEECVHSKVEDQTDEEPVVRGRSSFRLGARTPRSPTPFCRQPVNMASDDDEDDDEDVEEGHNESKTSYRFAEELEAATGCDNGDEWHVEAGAFAVDQQGKNGSSEGDDTKGTKHSVRFAQEESITEEFESTEAKKVMSRVPQSKGRVRSRRDPTPFVRRVYEDSESEDDENEDKSSKADECGSATVAGKNVDEESGDEFTTERKLPSHHRKRETSPMRDEVVQTERIPLRDRFGTSEVAEQSPEPRKRTVQFSDLPSRESVPGSDLKKVSSRRPTPFGLREYSIHDEYDDDDANSSS